MVIAKGWGALGFTAMLVLGVTAGHADQVKSKNKTAAPKVRPTSFRSEDGGAATLPKPRAAQAPSMELGTAKPSVPLETTGQAETAPCSIPSRSLWCRLHDWLTYRTVTHTTVCGKETCCTPPIYAYFLDYCPPAKTAHRIDHYARWAEHNDTSEKESSSWFSWNLFGKSSERRATKPTGEKAAEHQQAAHKEVVPAVRKDRADVKPVETEILGLDGKDCGKWRGLPMRRN